MPGNGRLPGPLIPAFPEASFQLMTTPAYKVTAPPCAPPPGPPSPPPAPLPPPAPDGPEQQGWLFNPLDPAHAARKAVQDTLDRKLELFPPGSCQQLPAPEQPKNADPQWVVQVGDQSTRHWRFPHSSSYGPVVEHALAVSVGRNWPLHPEGQSGFEFQLALAFLYDFYYLNDRRQSQEAYLDHAPAHRPKNLQLILQMAYLWPFFVEGGDSLVDVSVLGQLVPAVNWAYDYDRREMAAAGQLQIVLGGTVTIKPFGHDPDGGFLARVKKGFFISVGVQGGATVFTDPNTFDFAGVFNVGTQF